MTQPLQDLEILGIWNNGKTPTCEQKPTSHIVEWCFEHKNFKQIVWSCLKAWYFVNESSWLLDTKYKMWIIQIFPLGKICKMKKMLKNQDFELAYFTHEQCYPFHEYFMLKYLICDLWINIYYKLSMSIRKEINLHTKISNK